MPRCELDHRFSIEGGSPCILVLSPWESIMFLTNRLFHRFGHNL